MNLKKAALKLHEKLKGKIEIKPKIKVNKNILSLIYTPGVAQASLSIFKNKKNSYKYTWKSNNLAIISDGSRLLELGNKGGEAAIPVMEGKALLYKEYGDINAIPICLKTQEKWEIINLVENIALNFGAINIEDIEAPKCFEIVDDLSKKLSIPVFHDDQHGTAVVVLAALINSLKLVKKKLDKVKIVVLGAGAAGYGITKLLNYAGAKNILVLDSQGIVSPKRYDLNMYKLYLAKITDASEEGTLKDAIKNADVFIGVSGQENILSLNLVKKMNNDAIIFALSNPNPEILPNKARKSKNVKIIATGRGDFNNQVNNALVFPFIMRYILDKKIININEKLLYDFAKKLAKETKNLNFNHIIKGLIK